MRRLALVLVLLSACYPVDTAEAPVAPDGARSSLFAVLDGAGAVVRVWARDVPAGRHPLLPRRSGESQR